MSNSEFGVLLIDDDPGEATALVQDAFGARTITLDEGQHWRDGFEQIVKTADLIVTDWEIVPEAPPKDVTFPRDGRALNELVRSIRADLKNRPLYTIFSAKLEEIPPEDLYVGRPHVLAEDLGADWVGRKQESRRFVRDLEILIAGLKALRATGADQDRILRTVIPSRNVETWTEDLLLEVLRYQPPLKRVEERSQDYPAFLRWIAHVVLPYPTFLIDANELSVRLRLEPAFIEQVISDPEHPLQLQLKRYEYTGVLANLQGKRWWRAGIDRWIWDLTNGKPYERDVLKKAMTDVAGKEVSSLQHDQPILIRDELGRPWSDSSERIANITDGIRIQPDRWPAVVPWPWTLCREARKDPMLRRLVLPDDLYRLEAA